MRWSGFYFVPPHTVENSISLNYEGLTILSERKMRTRKNTVSFLAPFNL